MTDAADALEAVGFSPGELDAWRNAALGGGADFAVDATGSADFLTRGDDLLWRLQGRADRS